MVDLAQNLLVFAIGVLVWEFILATITYFLLKRRVSKAEKDVRIEALKIASEIEAKYAPFFVAIDTAIKSHEETIKRLADWVAEEEKAALEDEEIRHREMQERGVLGQQTQRDRRELENLAYQEGVSIIKSAGTQDEKQAKLLRLLRSYPQVALVVARRLNRAFRISQALGMSEEALIQIVAQNAAQALQAGEQIQPRVPDGY